VWRAHDRRAGADAERSNHSLLQCILCRLVCRRRVECGLTFSSVHACIVSALSLCVLLQRFRTITIDKKTVKLQIWVRSQRAFRSASPRPSLSLSPFVLSGCVWGPACSLCLLLLSVARLMLSEQDTAGQERFRTITSAYYRGADGSTFNRQQPPCAAAAGFPWVRCHRRSCDRWCCVVR
jgi:hypothetical protein